MLIIKELHYLLMCKDTTLFPEFSKEKEFSFGKASCGKKIRIDFNAPDLSSNGGLVLLQGMDCGLLDKIADCIPDWRTPELIHHTIRDMVRQRVGQIACGYEDANDCDALRHDSALKMLAGRKPSDDDLCSQPTMTRLENHVSNRNLYTMGCLFVENFIKSFKKAPKRIILDADDTNANTYGAQQLTLFNDYYGEYCYMPLLIYEGLSGKMILPILRPGRHNKSLNVSKILIRIIKRLQQAWPQCRIELRGDSHFCSHELMDWVWDQRNILLGFTTGLSSNDVLRKKIDKSLRRWRKYYDKEKKDVRRFYSFRYKAKSWKHEQRVIAKIEISSMGENIRFVVTSNHANKPETVYRHYAGRGEMELWIKDLKSIRGDRMSCKAFMANQFRLFLYAAADSMLYNLKHEGFEGTDVEAFTIGTFIKRIMLSAVTIKEQKCAVRISFLPHHRHRADIEKFLGRIAV
jgi:hypothetical protein